MHRGCRIRLPRWASTEFVGGEVGKGYINLVADGRHDRESRRGDRGHDDFFVERPEIFLAATPTGDDDDIRRVDLIGQFDRSHDLQMCAGALNPGRDDQDSSTAPTAADNLKQVTNRRAGRAADDDDATRIAWQWSLSRWFKQTLL